MAKYHIGWSLARVTTKHPNLTSTVSSITCIGDVLLIDIQVDATSKCNDRQHVGLVQARPDERRGAIAQHVVMRSSIVYRGDELVGPIVIDEEGIILRLRTISAEHHPTKLPVDDDHLDLVSQIAKVRRLRKARRIRCADMIDSPTERTAKLPIRRGRLGPIIGVVCTQAVIKRWSAMRHLS